MIQVTALTGLAEKAKFLLNDNSHAILTGVGVAGSVTTAYLSGRASFKAAQLIAQEREHALASQASNSNGHQDLTTWSKVGLVWRLYLIPVGTGVATVVSIVAANRVAARKIAALAVATGISERALQEYKEKVVDRLGDREHKKMRDEIAQERVLRNPHDTRQVVIAGTGDVLCYDMLTGRYFISSAEKIRRAENRINHELNHSMYASLSEFYENVGLPPTTYTDLVGWHGNESLEVQISTVMSDDEKPCLAIDFTPPPNSEYRRSLYD
jgi:hypothetical protein